MQISLYELAAELERIERMASDWAADHEGDLTEFPFEAMLDELHEDFEKKALDVACYVKTKRAIADAHRKEEERQAKAKRQAVGVADRLTKYLQQSLKPGQNYYDARAHVGWHTATRVHVVCDPKDLPHLYQRVLVEANKTLLQKALKGGEAIEGVALEVERTVVIR